MDKLRFVFEMKSTADGKTNMVCITSIETPDGRKFLMPIQHQNAYSHKEITATNTFTKIKNSITKRHQVRRVWIPLTNQTRKIYLDDEENMQFAEIFLEEIEENTKEGIDIQNINEQLAKILDKLIETQQQNNEISITKIAAKFILNKFTNKNSNAFQWINNFEDECSRLRVFQDKNKIILLKLFLDKSCLDWYSSMIIKLTSDSEWETWKNTFCETFANKGWSPITFAHAFRYQSGSLLNYAMKKERLLLEVNKNIDTNTLVDLIAVGLPNFVSNLIDRETLKSTHDLYNEIGKLEHLTTKRNYENKNKNQEQRNKIEKKPCRICESKSKGVRYHPESTCWFKNNDGDKIKNVNNSILETELSFVDPKN